MATGLLSTTALPTVKTPANVASVVAPPTPQIRQVTEPETVSGQLNALLKEDSSYIQSARAKGAEAANSRGLINSSIAAGATEKAAIDAALPIATQDANTFATSGLSAQTARQDQSLTGYKSLLDSAQQTENFGFRTAENEQNIAGNLGLQKQAQEAQAGLQSKQLEAEAARLESAQKATASLEASKQASDLVRQTQSEQAALNLQTTLKNLDIQIDLRELAARERESYTSAISPVIQQVQAEISQIQRTPDSVLSYDDKLNAINQLNANLTTQLQTITQLYRYPITWSAPTATPTEGQLAAATRAGAESVTAPTATYEPWMNPGAGA